MEDKTHFGNRIIDKAEKATLVTKLFSNVASKYDIMNDAMSIGMHRLWKNKMVSEIPKPSINRADLKILDIASGTADIMIRYIKSLDSQPDITLTDLNPEMLAIGKDKIIDSGIIIPDEKFIIANAENLPFEDNSFDAVTISFGIRNFTDIQKALNEVHRVLKPMGKFICLEFSKVENNLFSKVYDFYSENIIPKLGKIIADDKDAYQYLIESIRKFPSQREFAEMIQKSGMSKVSYYNLSMGICAIHTGWKICS